MSKLFDKLESPVLLATLFFSLVLVLPFFNDAIGLPKLVVLSIGVSLILLIKAFKAFYFKTIELTKNEFDFPLLVITLSYIVSGAIRTPSKMEAFFVPGTATLVIGCFLLYYLIGRTQKNIVKIVLFVSGIIISLVSILSFAKTFKSEFSLLGGELPTLVYLAAVLPLGIGLGVKSLNLTKKIFFFVASGIVLLGIGISLFGLFPKGSKLSLPSFVTSWSIAFDTLKQSPILGAGPGNYLSSFNMLKPIAYNSTDLWSIRCSVARNFYLTVITETGLFGLAGLILLGIKLAKNRPIKEEPFISLVVLLALLAIFPATISHIILLFVLLSLVGRSAEKTITLPEESKTARTIIATPIVILVLVFYFFVYKALYAEASFKKSIDSLGKNDGKAAYDLMRKSISQNTYVDRYHLGFAQVNLALAQAIAQNKNITEEDKKTISQLIQEAIRQGKAAVYLNQQRSGNWELLAKIYQAIIPYAQGSDQFAVQSYAQTVALDPINPTLRIAQGGVYYSMGKWDEAIEAFKLAVTVKPDLANAHYNLSAAYRESGEIDRAIAEINIVLSLVPKDSADEATAKAELEALNKKKPTSVKAITEGQSLTAPTKAQVPVIAPPLELPQEATPPATVSQ